MIDEHPVIFPNILRQETSAQIRVPMDRTTHKSLLRALFPAQNGEIVGERRTACGIHQAVQRILPTRSIPYTKFRMDMVRAQDHMAWETQGPIADRTTETADQLGSWRHPAARSDVP